MLGGVKLTEQELQNTIRIALSENGFINFRVNVGKVKTADGRWFDTGLPKGSSDVWAVKDGKIYFLEIKTPKGKATQEQKNFIQQMKQAGCVAGVVRSSTEALELVNGGNYDRH